MYEMVSGKVPFTGDNPVTVALKHMQDQPPSLLAQRSDVPLGLERIIFKALEKNPAYRFKSMQEMADALIDLQLYLEERGYFQQDAALTDKEKDYGSFDSYERETERPERGDERKRRGSYGETAQADDDHTRVMRHDYLRDEPRYEGMRKTKKKNVLVLVVAAILLFLATFLAVQGFLSHDEVAVPDLHDKTLLEAEELLSQYSLKIKVEDEVYDAEIEKDHIIRQNPKADTKVKEGREIAVVISLGSDEAAVPDLKGKTEQEARIALENEGLELGMLQK